MRYETPGRSRTIILSLALILASIWAPHVRAASPVDGLWDATVVSNTVEIPFRFEIASQGTAVTGFFSGQQSGPFGCLYLRRRNPGPGEHAERQRFAESY